MAKLILSLDGAYIGEYALDKKHISIGRRAISDIHIDNLGVSGEHATIVTVGNDSFIEDLASTNGTLVNRKPVKKHMLHHGDEIEFGKYQIKYIRDSLVNAAAPAGYSDTFEKTIMISPTVKKAPQRARADEPQGNIVSVEESLQSSAEKPLMEEKITEPTAASSESGAKVKTSEKAHNVGDTDLAAHVQALEVGRVQVLTGSGMGKELVLNKALTTLGKPGVQVAVIIKRPQGYFITHVEGQNRPIINAISVGAQAHALNNHDVIEMVGVKMEFYLAKA